MLAFGAGHGLGHLEDRLLKYAAPSLRHRSTKELRGDSLAEHLVLAPQLPLQNVQWVKGDQLGFNIGFGLGPPRLEHGDSRLRSLAFRLHSLEAARPGREANAELFRRHL